MKCPVCDRQVNGNGLHDHKVYRIPSGQYRRFKGMKVRASEIYLKVKVHAKCNDAYLVTRRLLEAAS